jgi:hypothetical protein
MPTDSVVSDLTYRFNPDRIRNLCLAVNSTDRSIAQRDWDEFDDTSQDTRSGFQRPSESVRLAAPAALFLLKDEPGI